MQFPDDAVIVPLGSRRDHTPKFAAISKCDSDRVLSYSWHPHLSKPRPNSPPKWYAMGKVEGEKILLHRFVLEMTPDQKDEVPDHINGNGLDCTRNNLRIRSRSMNAMNVRTYSSTGFKGVSRRIVNGIDTGLFIVQIYAPGGDNRPIRLGYFHDAEEGARVYDEAARKMRGKDARLNFPMEGELSARPLTQ